MDLYAILGVDPSADAESLEDILGRAEKAVGSVLPKPRNEER